MTDSGIFATRPFFRIKHGQAITTKTIDELCFVLQCSVAEVLEYLPADRED